MGDKLDIEVVTQEQDELWKIYNDLVKKKVDFRTWIKWEENTKQLSLI